MSKAARRLRTINRRDASREPLTAENTVVFKDGRHVHRNTPGHVHALAANGVSLIITEGRERYLAWCATRGVAPHGSL